MSSSFPLGCSPYNSQDNPFKTWWSGNAKEVKQASDLKENNFIAEQSHFWMAVEKSEWDKSKQKHSPADLKEWLFFLKKNKPKTK